MATFVNDTFTATGGTGLASHTGETGATWTQHPSSSGTASIDSNQLHADADSAQSIYTASGVPASADYDVQADIVAHDTEANSSAGVTGRHDTTADTFYHARYDRASAGWQLFKRVAGTFTQLGSTASDTLNSGTSKTVKLSMSGTSISVYVNGALTIGPVTDSAISSAGRAGLRIVKGTGSTGTWMDNFSAVDAVVAAPAWDKLVIPTIQPSPQIIEFGPRAYAGYGSPPADWIVSPAPATTSPRVVTPYYYYY